MSGVTKQAGSLVGGLTGGLVGASGGATSNYSNYGGQVSVSPDEQNYINQLQSMSNGHTQDPAIQQALTQGNAQAQALAASQRGVNPAMAARLAAQGQASNTQNAAALGAVDQRQTMGMLGQQLSSVRTGQIQQQANATSGNNAAMQAQAGVAGGLMQGGGAALAMFANEGALVPGHAQVRGNSLENDTVPAMLSPGEAVIPRSVMQGKDPGEMAKEFVDQLKSQGRAKGEPPSYGAVLKAHRELGAQLEMLSKGQK